MNRQDLESQKKILLNQIQEIDDKVFGLEREKIALQNQLNKVNHSLSRMVVEKKTSKYTDYRIEDDKYSYHVRRKNIKEATIISARIVNKSGRDAHYPKAQYVSGLLTPRQSLLEVVLLMPKDIREALNIPINIG